MQTTQKIVNNLMNENIFLLKVSLLRQASCYLGITSLCQNTHFTFKILQYICFIWTYYNCSYIKWVSDMSQYNYPIFNMQDFRSWLCTSSFGQLVSLMWDKGKYSHGVLMNSCSNFLKPITDRWMGQGYKIKITNCCLRYITTWFLLISLGQCTEELSDCSVICPSQLGINNHYMSKCCYYFMLGWHRSQLQISDLDILFKLSRVHNYIVMSYRPGSFTFVLL